jgi:hypothetical protein
MSYAARCGTIVFYDDRLTKDLPLRTPITGIAACCACAACGQAAAAPPSSLMKSRRLMGTPPQA